jgi:hypothetical protein
MSTPTKYIPNEVQAATPASWSQVKYWAGLSVKLQQGSVAAQIMAGFVLKELHAENGIKAGARTDLPSKSGGDRKSWPQLCKENAGISDDTARTWMNMADGIRASWKKLAPQDRLRELMRVSPADWSKEDTKLIGDAVKKATDGASQIEFMRSIGVAKKPKGASSTGRAPGCDNTKKRTSLADEAALRKSQAIVDWVDNWKQLAAYGDKFLLLPDDLVTAQIATLEQALKARKEWIKQPLNKRDTKAIAEMVQFNPQDAEQFEAALNQLAPETK